MNNDQNLDKQIKSSLSFLWQMQRVKTLHSQVFPRFKNLNAGKDVVIVATGPTLNNYVPIKDAVHIGVNAAFRSENIILDYLFMQDYTGLKDYIESSLPYKNPNLTRFYGIEPYGKIKDFIIPESIALRHNAYRYYVHSSFSDTPELPDTFAYDLTSEELFSKGSIAFAALQFALWTNPKRIYLVGCDCSSAGYFYTQRSSSNFESLINNYKLFKDFASIYYPETEIISINPVGLRGVFKDVYSDEYGNYTDKNTSIVDSKYTEQYRLIHDNNDHYGASSIELIEQAKLFIDYLCPKTVLDYGCGKGALIKKLQEIYPNIKFYCYDPSIKGIDFIPVESVDLIINTDVLEHIPEAIIPNVLNKMSSMTSNIFFALHHAKSSAVLPNGENAHITVKPREWYKDIMTNYFPIVNVLDGLYEYTSTVTTFEMPSELLNRYNKLLAQK